MKLRRLSAVLLAAALAAGTLAGCSGGKEAGTEAASGEKVNFKVLYLERWRKLHERDCGQLQQEPGQCQCGK